MKKTFLIMASLMAMVALVTGLAAVLKQAGYQTFFTGKWHLGEADYALPIAQGYDEMKYVGLYHLNAYTYGDPEWFPEMPAQLREMFNKVTKGILSGKAGEKAIEEFKVNIYEDEIFVFTPKGDLIKLRTGATFQFSQRLIFRHCRPCVIGRGVVFRNKIKPRVCHGFFILSG